MFGKNKKGKKDYPEMVDSIQGSPKEEPDYGGNTGNYNSYPMEKEEWPEDVEQLYGNYAQERTETFADSIDADYEVEQEEAPEEESVRTAAASSKAQEFRQPERGKKEDGDKVKPEVFSERDQARLERQKRRKKELRRVRIAFFLIFVLVLGLGCAGGYYVLRQQGTELFDLDSVKGSISNIKTTVSGWLGKSDSNQDKAEPETVPSVQTETAAMTESETQVQTESPAEVQVRADLMAQADLKAAQYDYDGAAELLKSYDGYDTNMEMQQKVAGYEASKAACVEISPDTVSHVFVHSLIVDTSRAFDGDAAQDGYNLNMVTVDEFKKIIQSMYDNGYVLVSLHDMGEIDADGKMQRKSIRLPEGKKPVVFSQDDVSYYHSYSGDGFADRLIVDENGEVKNEYTDAAGNTTVGDYDMVPVLDTFIKEHPDFSYHGQKGIIALTGYNGVLGYRTDGDYRDQTSLQEDQRKWLEEHPDYDFDADVAAAKKVADAMKANGWEFASHTWGHISVGDRSLEAIQTDTQKWLDYVKPIVGDTDMIIFAFGSDIGDWTGYASDNDKYNYLKSAGFDYFCNVDGSTLCWVQFGDTYLRQARMNIDGYRMATNPDILAPLFDVSSVYDTSRPAMAAWSQ